MTDTIDGVEYEYEVNRFFGEAPVVLFLHGWGGDLRSFAAAFAAVTDMGYAAVNFAFPKEVPESWGVYDYAAFVKSFMKKLNITEPVAVGHSFGGRIAIILAAQRLIGKLVLVDSAGMKPRFSLRKKVAVMRYRARVKRGKPLDGMGSIDYNNTSGGGRKVFVRIVNAHLEKLLPYIECPTLVIWGRNDADTPPYMARRLHRGIAHSTLEYIDGGHYGYIESNYKFMRLLKTFLSE